MAQIAVFDIVGPIMVGPSSSHTAGAVRLGRAGRVILGEPVAKADMYLHGSFAATYWGHRTDIALLAGLLDMAMDDPAIPDAKDLAAQVGMEYHFHREDLGDVHPNSVRLKISGQHNFADMIGASIGGGRIVVYRLNGFPISYDGSYWTLISRHRDEPGVIADITRVLGEMRINIGFLEVGRRQRGSDAMLVAQTDSALTEDIIAKVSRVRGVFDARGLPKF